MEAVSKRRRALAFALPLCGIAFLFLSQLVALSKYRLDFPLVDDWRYYTVGYMLPDALSLEWLFDPFHDTVHVTNKLFDWLIFHFLSHDYSLLATLTFTVFFGGWLVSSVALCFVAGRGGDPLVLLSAMLLFSLPLAGAPHWVTTSPYQWPEAGSAYAGMLPVLGLSVLGLLALAEGHRWPRGLKPTLAAALAAVFALAYSSGAFALLLFGGTLMGAAALVWRFDRSGARSILPSGAAIALVAAGCLALHILLPLQRYGANPATTVRVFELTLPTTAEFWRFFFALFDRAVLSTAIGSASELRGTVVATAFALPAAVLTVLLARGRLHGRQQSTAIVLVAILVAIAGYAALVSYGRAGFGGRYFPRRYPPETRVTLYAHSRFFFWWITAALPLSAMAWGLVLERLRYRRAAGGIAIGLLLLALWPKDQHPDHWGRYFQHWDYGALYRRDAEVVADLAKTAVVRARGGRRQAILHRRWLQIPRRLRNPRYAFHAGPGRDIAIYFEVAARKGATFPDRWGFVPPDRLPSR